jgi:hypothetical protein
VSVGEKSGENEPKRGYVAHLIQGRPNGSEHVSVHAHLMPHES